VQLCLPNASPVPRSVPAPRAGTRPHLRFADGTVRGYVATALSAAGARAEFRAVGTVKRADAGIRTLARIEIEAGRPGVHVARA
jgi:alkaline phosphatase D